MKASAASRRSISKRKAKSISVIGEKGQVDPTKKFSTQAVASHDSGRSSLSDDNLKERDLDDYERFGFLTLISSGIDLFSGTTQTRSGRNI